jgi:Ulp1 family protease
VEGLFCLKDGELLNADIIDTYLHAICQNSKRIQYIPTYAILSVNRKKKIPSAWYWNLHEVEIVLAPAHLNNNHWAMAVVNIPERTIHIMDSMNNGLTGQTKREFMENIL